MSLYKPAPPHNPILAPAICMCVDCSRIVLALRCTARSPTGDQCGDYRGHGGEHTLLVCTTFDIAADRAKAQQ